MSFFRDEIKPKILKTMEPIIGDEEARSCLENNLLVFTVEYLRDLKQTRRIDEGLVVAKDA